MNISEIFFLSNNTSLTNQSRCAVLPGMQIRHLSYPFDKTSVTSFLKESGASSMVVLDIEAVSLETSEHIIDLCRTQGAQVIIFSTVCDAELKKFLLRKGVADIFNERSVQYLWPYLSLLREQHGSSAAGTILILDDTPCVTDIIRSILQRFCYSTVITSTLQDFFEELPHIDPSLILVGLSTKKFDIQAFIKKAHGDPAVRRAPLIAYKKPDDGIYIHELISGISRYTKVILSPVELYSLLLHLIFRREIAPHLGTLSSSLDFTGFSMLSGSPLSQMYYNLGVDLCSEEYIFTEEKIPHIHRVIENISGSLIKVESIKWLAGNNETRATCATYV